MFGVADGVGGLPGGAEAAQCAIDEIAAEIRTRRLDNDEELVSAVQQVNATVAALGQRMSPSMGIGTTLTFGRVHDGILTIAHVGDSRCYGVRNRELIRLTEDHSVENEARLRRAKGEVVYYHEANRNALTRCIGQPTVPEVDIITRPLAVGDRYAFCSDGITRMLPDSDLRAVLNRYDNPTETVNELVTLAVRRGGPDNATAVVIFVDAV